MTRALYLIGWRFRMHRNLLRHSRLSWAPRLGLALWRALP